MEQPKPPERLYSPQDISVMLGLKTPTIRRYIREGTLSAIRINGKSLRVPESEYLKFLRGKDGQETT